MAKDPKKKEKKEQKSNFIKEVNGELKKVTWPTGKELVTSTATVLFITLTIAIIVFVLDFAFEKANTFGVEKLKTVVSSSEEKTGDEVVTPETTEDTTTVEPETTAEEGTVETPSEEGTEVAPEGEATTEEAKPTEEVTE